MQQAKKFSIWLGKIETTEQALKVIKDCANGFYVLAGIQALLGMIQRSALIDAVVIAVLAFLLQRYKSRVVALILVTVSLLSIIATGMNKFGEGTGGRNIVLAVIMAWAAVRSVQATFILSKLRGTRP